MDNDSDMTPAEVKECELIGEAVAKSVIAAMEERARELDWIQPRPFRDLCYVMLPGDRRLACCNPRAVEQQQQQIELNDRVIDKQRVYLAQQEVKLAELEAKVAAAEEQLGFAGRKPN
jgi:uncharacterized coiled-coil protein SlyX